MEWNTNHVASAAGNQYGTRGTLLLTNELLQGQERQRKRDSWKTSSTSPSCHYPSIPTTQMHGSPPHILPDDRPRPAREPRADGQPQNKQDAFDDGARHKGLPAWLQGAVRQCSDIGKRNWTVNLTVCRTSSNVWICLNSSMIHDHTAHFFLIKCGSKICNQLAQFFIDIHINTPHRVPLTFIKIRGFLFPIRHLYRSRILP